MTRRERRRAQLLERKTHRRAEPGWVVPGLAAAFVLSGSAGLIHEVVWARLLGLMFGATSLAICTVLAAFMGGLAIGSYWLGKRSHTFADRRRTYALLELGIGGCALVVPVVLALVAPMYGWLWRRFHWSFAMFSVLRFVVAGGILLGPTILMGATLPVLADYLAGLERRRLAPQWLYTANLAGAVLGVAAAGFVLMPAVGVWGTIAVGAGLNIGVGLGVLRLPRLAEQPQGLPAGRAAAPARRLLLVAAAVSGLSSLATQVAWTRVLALVVGSTTYAFSAVLIVYLVALGVGSAWASRRGARGAEVGTELAAMHLLMALCTLGALYLVNRLPSWYLGLYHYFHPQTLGGIVALTAAVVFVVLFWPVVCAGTILPLALIGVLPGRGGDTGGAVGRIYAINTVGAIAGAVLSGFVFIPLAGTQATLVGVAVVGAGLGVVFALGRPRPRWLPGAAAAAAALVVAGVVARPQWHTFDLNIGVFEPERVRALPSERPDLTGRPIYYREGPTSTVMVVERPDSLRVMLINGRSNASDHPADMPTQVLLAQIPLLLAPHVDDVFLVGWGSGVTAGAALQSSARRITAVELEPAVVEASRFFVHANHDPLHDPRVRLYEDDARHILLASADTYDVIVSEPPHPWVSGVANLFTQDFYRLAARRLRPAGVFAQWLQSYQISLDTYRAIVAAFQSVFPEVLVFNPPGGIDSILVGARQRLPLDLGELDRRWAAAAPRAELARVGLGRPEQLLAALYLGPDGVRALVRGARINTDNNMYVEFRGPRDTIRAMDETSAQTFAALARYAAPIETMLTDPAALLGNRDRLRALIDGLEHVGRDPARYRNLLAHLD